MSKNTSEPVAFNTARRDEAAEKYEATVESKHGNHWDCCYSSYTVQYAFEAGWDARDEEVKLLRESFVNACHDITKLDDENKRLNDLVIDYQFLWKEANKYSPEENTLDGFMRIKKERDRLLAEQERGQE